MSTGIEDIKAGMLVRVHAGLGHYNLGVVDSIDIENGVFWLHALHVREHRIQLTPDQANQTGDNTYKIGSEYTDFTEDHLSDYSTKRGIIVGKKGYILTVCMLTAVTYYKCEGVQRGVLWSVYEAT